MSTETVTYSDIQQALERCMSAEPADGIEYRLSKDASLLGDILGDMIYRRLVEIGTGELAEKHLDALRRWK